MCTVGCSTGLVSSQQGLLLGEVCCARPLKSTSKLRQSQSVPRGVQKGPPIRNSACLKAAARLPYWRPNELCLLGQKDFLPHGRQLHGAAEAESERSPNLAKRPSVYRRLQPLAHPLAILCAQHVTSRVEVNAGGKPPHLKVSPTIVPLSSKTLSKVLPYSGTGDQVLFTLGGIDAWARRLGISLVGTFAFYNVSVVLTALASLFWVWSPIVGAATANTGLRLRFKYAGVWKTHILKVQQVPAVLKGEGDSAGVGRWGNPSTSESGYAVWIGDAGGVTVQVTLPRAAGRPVVRAGDVAEVLVLSDRPNCSRFRAVRDVFLPGRKLWLSQEHGIERTVFEEISSRLGHMRPLGDSPPAEDLDHVYSARVFELDLSPDRLDDLHSRHPPDRVEGEHLASFSDGSEALGGPEVSLSEDWLAPEVDPLPREAFWER